MTPDLTIADEVLTVLQQVTLTDQVRRDIDLELFDQQLLDSLGVVELLVELGDRLGIELSPAEFDRGEWSTPRKIITILEARLGGA